MKVSVWLCVVVLGAVTWFAALAPAYIQAEPADVPALGLPAFSGCTSHAWSSPWIPEVRGTTSEVRATYRCSGRQVHMFAGQFIDRSSGAEAFSETQRIVPPVWAMHSTSASTQIAHGFEVNEYRLAVDGRELRVLSWFAVGEEPYRTRWRAKLAEVLDAVQLRSRPAAVLAVATEDGAASDQLPEQAAALWQWYRLQLERQREVSS